MSFAAQDGRAVDLVCGKCPPQRVLARFVVGFNAQVAGTTGRRQLQRGKEIPNALPAPDRMYTLKDAGPPGRNYPCHKRCGANWTIPRERLERAVLKAVEDRRGRIVAGVDL
jgi:hypothetical protein